MRFLMMHRLAESAPEVRDPSPEFVEEVGAFVQDWIDRGVLISAEGVHPSERGALVRKAPDGAIAATDGPFTETKEVVGGFLLINAEDRAAAVECARRYADLFGQVEIEVRQVVEFEDLPPAP
ncbi:YciI family protein [Saccharothrix longispora]|uniref:YCII-related domain-containing protein n=1 Tax=Saccharothrix longispora TaxID=33920 RepID=A0ABU1PQ50_9PSEU|nr:YciI family protein [Saccharothrix longispora]MDR6592759.1 hypothetical protein [Saccharothrix longispora]